MVICSALYPIIGPHNFCERIEIQTFWGAHFLDLPTFWVIAKSKEVAFEPDFL